MKIDSTSAEFVERVNCINCGSTELKELSKGFFRDKPLSTFIEQDPWEELPMPYIKDNHWIYVKCQKCQQTFHQRILSPKWLDKCYSDWVSEKAIQEFINIRNLNSPEKKFEKGRNHVLHILRLESLTRKLRVNTPLRILDFGCGYGDFLATCSCFGFDGYGIDFSPARRSNSRFSILPNLEDLKSLDESKQKFHVITLFEVLEHLAAPLEILESLSNFIVDEGILVLETPDCTNITDIKTANDYRKINPLSHINGFTSNTLISIAQRAGFDRIDRGAAHAISNSKTKIIKTEIKGLVENIFKPTTQHYFRKRSRKSI